MAGTLTLDSWPGTSGFTTASYFDRFLEQMQFGMPSTPGLLPSRDADILGSYTSEGLVVGDSSGMLVKVSQFRAVCKGVFAKLQDSAVSGGVYQLTVSNAHATLQRIDRVIVRFDLSTGAATLRMLDGTAASTGSAVPAALTRSATTWDIQLALVIVDATATTIANIDVVDKREFTYTNDSLMRALAIENPTINGGMEVWNVGTTFTSAGNGQWGPELFVYSKVGAVVHDMLQSTDVPSVDEAVGKEVYSLHLDVTTADASIAAGDECIIRTFIEGSRAKPFLQRGFVYPFWVKAAKLGLHSINFQNSGADRVFVGTYFIEAVDTWELHWIHVPPSPTAGTWNYTNGTGLRIEWVLAAGTNFHTTPNSWHTPSITTVFASSRQVNELDSTANNFKLTMVGRPGLNGVMLPFSPNSDEEDLCTRYFIKTFTRATAPAQATSDATGALTYICQVAGTSGPNGVMWVFPRPMRTAPTITTYNTHAAASTWRNASLVANSGAATALNINEGRCFIYNAQIAGDLVTHQIQIHASATARMS